jgi:hypothetical protein
LQIIRNTVALLLDLGLFSDRSDGCDDTTIDD